MILNNQTVKNQIPATSIMFKIYQNNLWVMSKKADFSIRSIESRKILNILTTRRERKENNKEYTLCLAFMLVVRLRTKRR